MSEWFGTEIAIIGMSGRFPGSDNVQEFWEHLVAGDELIHYFTDEELLQAGVDPAVLQNPNYVKARSIIRDVDKFDATFFGYRPREAEVMDPQQRLFLETAWTALESSGYSPDEECPIGVFAGMDGNSYLFSNLLMNRKYITDIGGLQMQLLTDKDYLSTRVSYKLNLTGPSFTVQTACSTSLVAVHLASQSLINGECDIALAGGAGIITPQESGQMHAEGGITSKDGHCRPFDAAATGTVRGNGVGCVVLKRLADALADRDTIYSVIRGSVINNDGAGKVGFTAPSVDGQMKAILEAQTLAGVEPESIRYIEAHGTGTGLGDPIEIEALTQAFATNTDAKQFCAIGSVKSNIGHLGAASGVTGLIKTALALDHKLIPPSINYVTPNPQIDFANSPFFVNDTLRKWEADGTPRRAGVSSFGLGGTNAHVVLEEAPERTPSGPSRPWALLSLSAKTAAALEQMTENLARQFEKEPGLSLADAAYTLHRGRKRFAHRKIALVRSLEDAMDVLNDPESNRVFTLEQTLQERPVAFLFSGQGSQYVNMGRELYETEARFRETVDACLQHLNPLLGFDLRQVLFPQAGTEEQATERLNQTELAQPALFVIEYALAHLWMSIGIEPQAMMGHSIGEYVAACLAGVFTLEEALQLVVLRGKLMQSLPAGAMVSVALKPEELQPHLQGLVSLAAVNSPSQCVVSGTFEQIEALEQRLSTAGITSRRLKTSHAFHSEMMDPILETFTEQVGRIRLQEPNRPFISNVTGTWITHEDATDPRYWARHLRQAVLFSQGMQTLAEQDDLVFLEVGPGTALRTLVGQQRQGQKALASLPHPQEKQSELAFYLQSLGRLWLEGVRVDWAAYYAEEQRNRIPLPTYAFDRKRFWVEPQHGAMLAAGETATAGVAVRTEEQDRADSVGTVAPEQMAGDAIEQKIIDVWNKLFGMETIERNSHFFELAGDSLLGVQMIAELRTFYQIPLELSTLFENPTVKGLATIIKGLIEEGGALTDVLPMVQVPRDQLIPASFAQERFWKISKQEPYRSHQHNDLMGMRIHGPVHIEALEKALNAVIERYEIFRTTYQEIDGQLYQVFSDSEPLRIKVQDIRPFEEKVLGWSKWKDGWYSGIRALSRRVMFGKMRELIKQETLVPFELGGTKLVRAALYINGYQDYSLLIMMHRITVDGWSMHVFQKELGQLYNAFAAGQPNPLPETEFQYADLAAWQRQFYSGDVLEKRMNYWKKELTGNPFDLNLPQDHPRPSNSEYKAGHHFFNLPDDLTQELEAMNRHLGITMFMTLLSAFKILLRNVSKQTDITVAVPVHNRTAKENQNIIGRVGLLMCIRTDFQEVGDDFNALLLNVRNRLLEGDQHILPFEQILQEMYPDLQGRFMPPYRVMFNYYDIPVSEPDEVQDVQISGLGLEQVRLDCDLTLVVRPIDDGYDMDLRYDLDMFELSTIKGFEEQYMQLLREFVRSTKQQG